MRGSCTLLYYYYHALLLGISPCSFDAFLSRVFLDLSFVLYGHCIWVVKQQRYYWVSTNVTHYTKTWLTSQKYNKTHDWKYEGYLFLHVLVQKYMGNITLMPSVKPNLRLFGSYETKHEGHSIFSIHADRNVWKNNELYTESCDFIAWGCALHLSITQWAILFTSLLVAILLDGRKTI